ncbi:EAL domain-containing protein [Furfurilactobacillus curtus]|uniref:Diguanylate cyclase n=1 Tax=Furfurilactobacillus curtus TaxID=1746200 RepID=A0ABQ5JS71_9LACO
MHRYFIQPQVNGATNTIFGYELLMKHFENQQWRPPRFFADIPATVIADTLIRTTQKLALKIGTVSINLNRTQLLNPAIVDAVITAQDQLRPLRLTIELTEEPGDDDISLDQLMAQLNKLLVRGIELSLDDVGSGINQRKQVEPLLPLASELKFALQNLTIPLTDVRVQNQVKTWHQLAIQRHCRFILEGIETAQEAQLVDDLGIALRQGYYYGRPHILKLAPADPQ